MLIGITGGIGSGKSVLCDVARDMGFYVISADKIGHDILRKGSSAYNEVVEIFGEGILSENGEIDRKKLGRLVFSDKEKLMLLNKMTHKRITEEICDIISSRRGEVIVLEAAILHESGLSEKCDVVIAVVAPENVRLQRILKRDLLSQPEAVQRIRSQKSNDFYRKNADYTIQNNGDMEKLIAEGTKIFKEVANGKV